MVPESENEADEGQTESVELVKHALEEKKMLTKPRKCSNKTSGTT